jgi:hypothetical protein
LILGGGNFETAVGIPGASGVLRFDGTSWHSLAGANGAPTFVSGNMAVHNGELITNSTIRHPDGSFSHWSRWGPAGCAPGDVNCDQAVDVADVTFFVAAALDPGSVDGCVGIAADINQDGLINGADAGGFVECLLAGGCP